MRNKWVQLGITAMAVSMLAGCISNETPPTSGGSTQEGGGGEAQAITYTFGRNIDSNADHFVKLQSQFNETLEDNRWTRLFHDELNVNITYSMISDSTAYNQKLKLAMASGGLPDVFQVQNKSDMRQLMEAGALEDLRPVYDEYASPLLKQMIEMESERVFEPASYKGGLYAIPMKMPSTNFFNHLWIREDWLTNLGLERPQSIEDVYAIAKAFTFDDPDQNGQNDTLGMQLDNGFLSNAKGFFWAFGAYPDGWVSKDGRAVSGVVQPEMKKPLQMLQQMFKEGLLDKEFGSKDNGKSMESVAAGKTGMFYGPHWSAFTAEKAIQNNPDARWIVVPLPGEGGKTVVPNLQIANDGFIAVKKGTPQPENIIRMFNLYVEKLFGENAEFDKYYSDSGVDYIWQIGPVYTLDSMLDLRAHQEIKQAMADGTTDQLKGVSAGFYANMEAGSWPMSMMFGPKDTPFAYVDQAYPDGVVWDAYMGAPTPTAVARGSSMDELILTTLTDIVLGRADADSGFDKMVQEWNTLGGEQMTKEVNDVLAE